jgi:hypothetical protein
LDGPFLVERSEGMKSDYKNFSTDFLFR